MENYFLNCKTEESIKIRFRALSKRFHPDKNTSPGAKEIFQEISNERDRLLKQIYKSQGKTDHQIDKLMNEVFNEFDFKNIDKLTDNLAENYSKRLIEEGKEPTHMNVFKMLIGDLFGTKQLPEDNKKRLK